jgi:glutathione synthase/RimK-type ligase-like ATP-grasp enzyme
MNQKNTMMNQTQIQQPLIGLAVLAKMAFLGADLSPLGNQMLERIASNPNDANALMDMSIILHLKGNRELGLALQSQALALQQTYRLGPNVEPAGTHLLALLSPGDLTQNNVVEFLVEGSDIVLDMLYVLPNSDLSANVPESDVLMVAVSESDRNRPLLKHVEDFIQSWSRPIINSPDKVSRTSRDEVCELLTSDPGIVVPVTTRINRETLHKIGQEQFSLSSLNDDVVFPVIVRPVDSHKGIGLKKLNHHLDILEYLKEQPEEDFYISKFVDYQSQDGLFRKYRIVFIGGNAFVCHMAISANWMVHYMSSGMTDSADKRNEEARFMETFDNDFGLRHQKAFNNIVEKIGLEFVGIDCGETTEGELLIFEIDSSMTIHAMDPIDDFPYKHLQLRKVFNAFRDLLRCTKDQSSKNSSILKKSNGSHLQLSVL